MYFYWSDIQVHTKTNHSLVVPRIVKGGKEFNGYGIGMACLSISNKKQQLDFALFYDLQGWRLKDIGLLDEKRVLINCARKIQSD